MYQPLAATDPGLRKASLYRLPRLLEAKPFVPLLMFILCAVVCPAQTSTNPITREIVTEAQKLIGLNFSESKVEMMRPGLKEQLDKLEVIRKFPLSNGIPPAILFNPIPVG